MPKRNGTLATLGLNVRKAREAKELTQEKLAEKAGLESVLKHFFAVVSKKISVRLRQFFRESNWLASKWNKVLFERRLREEFPQPVAQNNAQLVIQSDEASVKSRVVKRREAKSIARIEAVCRELAPRLDVARHQQAWHVDRRGIHCSG